MIKSGLFNVQIKEGFIPDMIVEGNSNEGFTTFVCIPLHVETGRYKKINLDLVKSTDFDDLGNVEIYMSNGEMFGSKVSSLSDDVTNELTKFSK